MERIINSDERIKRAEEIYNRRRTQNGVRVPTKNVNTRIKPEYRLLKKMILQILICLLIYFIFYLVKNSNYFFSENVIQTTKDFLAYDINLEEMFNKINEYYNKNVKGILDVEQNEETNNIEENDIQENENQIGNEETNTQIEGGIGGGEEGSNLLANEIVASAEEKREEPLTQMEIDANEIKQSNTFILPLKGTITSRFGKREATEIVSANHAGIDIGVNEGTIFVAAMEGTVTYVSTQGGYGNHVYIEKDDVTTLYAHCKTIYVKEGDNISIGEQIGEVGQTGNATGPHLHFEVRKANRVVNPEYILTF